MYWTHISGLEQKGAAAPVSVSNDYTQYLAYYGTESAYFLGQQYEGMLGTMYALYGISQTINMTGNAIRGIVHQRGALRVAIARNNLLFGKITVEGRADIGAKLEYVFGKATGTEHNIDRSRGMLRQLESVGIFDNVAGRSLTKSHLESTYSRTKGTIQPNGRFYENLF